MSNTPAKPLATEVSSPEAPAVSDGMNLFWTVAKRRLARMLAWVLVVCLSLSGIYLSLYATRAFVTKVDVVGPAIATLIHHLSPQASIGALPTDFALTELHNTPLPNGHGFKLSGTLISHSAIALAAPRLCLTLLDDKDAPIAFRVIALTPMTSASSLANGTPSLSQSIQTPADKKAKPDISAPALLPAHSIQSLEIDWVPIHDTQAVMVALDLEQSSPHCFGDSKIPLIL